MTFMELEGSTYTRGGLTPCTYCMYTRQSVLCARMCACGEMDGVGGTIGGVAAVFLVRSEF